MKRALLGLLFALAFLVGTRGTAWAASRCSDVRVESPDGARGLYFAALCGSQTEEVLATVTSGAGRVFTLAPELAAALDAATPLMHRVDHIYVRGGGDAKPTVVIPFTNGVDAVLFKSNAVWSRSDAEALAYYWNRAPYEFLRRASVKMHDAVLMEGKDIAIGINVFGLFIRIANLRGALAYPFGFVMITADAVKSVAAARALDESGSTGGWEGPGIAIHELAHYNQYHDEGLLPFAFTGEFGSISRRNCTFLWIVPIPFCFKDKDGVTDASYVSDYAHNGEMKVLEDYADTLATAVGATQAFRKSAQFLALYPTRALFESGNPFLREKAAFMTKRYTYSLTGPMDADRDGVTSSPSSGDCNDLNPAALGKCGDGAAITIPGPCTHDVCVAGERQGQACNACTMSVCNEDPYCCDTYWGASCFAAVERLCGRTCSK